MAAGPVCRASWKKLVIDIGCGRESQLAAILDPSEYHVVGIDPLLSPGKQGFCGSIFDFNLIELLENRCDLVVLTGAKTGNTNTAYLSDICSRFIKRNGRVVVIDPHRHKPHGSPAGFGLQGSSGHPKPFPPEIK